MLILGKRELVYKINELEFPFRLFRASKRKSYTKPLYIGMLFVKKGI